MCSKISPCIWEFAISRKSPFLHEHQSKLELSREFHFHLLSAYEKISSKLG